LQPDKAGSAPAFRVSDLRAPAEAHMPANLVSLCDLVELRAAKHHIPLVRLWKLVFAAIRDAKLDFGYPDEFESEYGGHNPPPHYVKHIREVQCVNALSAIENGDAFAPWSQLWVQRMLVSAGAFDKTLFPADKKQRRGPKPLVSTLADFLKKTFPAGLAHITNKQIAEMARNAIGRPVSEKTVTRARKRLLSDRTN
jgi:hypothetical protein